MKIAEIEKPVVPEIKIDWAKMQSSTSEDVPEPVEQEKPKQEEKDPYWKDYNEFLVNLA